MSKPWGGVGAGAWALEAERAEAEERDLAAAAAAPSDLFPSLKEAATSKPQKKKKPTTISLAEFAASKTLTPDEMLRLPTGPKERSSDELSGGFRSYGVRGEDSRRGPPASRVSDLDMPSRADEVDNWAAGKMKAASFSRAGDRYTSLGSGSSAKADEVDSWSCAKKPVSSLAPSRHSGFGSGFRDSGGSSDSERWPRGAGGGFSNDQDRDLRERPRLVLEPRKVEVGVSQTEMGKSRASPFGAARPREEVLAEKGLNWRKMDSEIEVKRPTSSHSSRPDSSQSSGPGSPGGDWSGKIGAKVNPFGDARPREILLEEKGRDWRKMDSEMEHRRVERPETEEEKLLREEVNYLKQALTEETTVNVNGVSQQNSGEQLANLREQISLREKDLERLIHELDSKVRFGQKAADSGSSRIAFSSDRPPSQSGMLEDSKSIEFMDRPRSRSGTGDSWGKPSGDRRGYQGGRETGFLVSRNMDGNRQEGW